MSKNKQTLNNVKLVDDIVSGDQTLSYDNSTSGLTATNIQSAVDEVQSNKVEKASNQALSTDNNVMYVEGNVLKLKRANGDIDTVDLSAYLDDTTNTIVSGTLSGNLITFTREDDSTFTVDVAAIDADTVDGVQASAITYSGKSVSLTGDVSGTTTVSADGSISISTTVADDSHNHVIANVDGLQDALDAKLHHNDTIYTSGGNVGVGTSTPSSKMTISRDTETTASQLELRNVSGISDGNYDGIKFTQGDGTTELGSIRCLYKNTGYPDLSFNTRAGEKMVLSSDGHLYPSVDNAQDLGLSTNTWRNIYTGDLHLSNEGHEEGNSIDNTKGNWTIQEGEENLYIINNKTGKKYKFALEEIE